MLPPLVTPQNEGLALITHKNGPFLRGIFSIAINFSEVKEKKEQQLLIHES